MEIRHAVNGGDVYRDSAGLTETALQVCAALAMAIGLERLRIRTGSIVHNAGAVVLTGFAGLAALFGLLFLDNPAIWRIATSAKITTGRMMRISTTMPISMVAYCAMAA